MSFFLNIANAFSVEKRAIKKMVKQEKRNEVIKSSLGKVDVPINSTKFEETTNWANPLNPLSPFSPIGPLSIWEKRSCENKVIAKKEDSKNLESVSDKKEDLPEINSSKSEVEYSSPSTISHSYSSSSSSSSSNDDDDDDDDD